MSYCESKLTFIGYLLTKQLFEFLNQKVKMSSVKGHTSGAFKSWGTIDWDLAELKVKQMQARIVKAVKEGKLRKVKSLQYLLVNSYYAKLLAVRRVTQNKGKNTPGVDGVRWESSAQKLKAANSLTKTGYKAMPLRRVNIPKSNGKLRPLGIPTMRDRGMQALYLMALNPIAETTADTNSYGFRPMRSCADAMQQIHFALSGKYGAKYVLEADIKGCFDNISHQWILENIPLDKNMLRQWLKAGIIENKLFSKTTKGTPQGGIISPVIANMILDGLEQHIIKVCEIEYYKGGQKKPKSSALRVNFIRYADDFIITAQHKELIIEKILPGVKEFLSIRGLEVQTEKTHITLVTDGFDFLGQNVRRYDNKLLIKPSKKSIKSVKKKLRDMIKTHCQSPAHVLINSINPIIKGWAYYHRHVVAKQVFTSVDTYIFQVLWQWAKRRHHNKSAKWIRSKYYKTVGNRNWVFFATADGMLYTLFRMETVPIRRVIKIRNGANPYDLEWYNYFEVRKICRVRY